MSFSTNHFSAQIDVFQRSFTCWSFWQRATLHGSIQKIIQNYSNSSWKNRSNHALWKRQIPSHRCFLSKSSRKYFIDNRTAMFIQYEFFLALSAAHVRWQWKSIFSTKDLQSIETSRTNQWSITIDHWSFNCRWTTTLGTDLRSIICE